MTGQGLPHIKEGVHVGVQARGKHHQRGLARCLCRLGQIDAGLNAVDDTTSEAERHLLKTSASRLRFDLKIRTNLWSSSQCNKTRIQLVLKIEILGQGTQQRADSIHIHRDRGQWIGLKHINQAETIALGGSFDQG